MSATDYYAVLGLPQTASDGEIRARFRELVQEQHPDRRTDIDHDQAVEKFQLLTQAANTLLDPERRVEYDRERRSEPRKSSVEDEAVRTLVQRGVAAFREGNLKLALDSLQKATQLAPDQGRIWHLLAQVASRVHSRRGLGLQAAQKAVELEPNNPKYLLTTARACLDAGRTKTAQQLLERAQRWGAEPSQVQRLLDQLEKRR